MARRTRPRPSPETSTLAACCNTPGCVGRRHVKQLLCAECWPLLPPGLQAEVFAAWAEWTEGTDPPGRLNAACSTALDVVIARRGLWAANPFGPGLKWTEAPPPEEGGGPRRWRRAPDGGRAARVGRDERFRALGAWLIEMVEDCGAPSGAPAAPGRATDPEGRDCARVCWGSGTREVEVFLHPRAVTIVTRDGGRTAMQSLAPRAALDAARTAVGWVFEDGREGGPCPSP